MWGLTTLKGACFRAKFSSRPSKQRGKDHLPRGDRRFQSRERSEGLQAVLQQHPEITIAARRFAGLQENQAKAAMTDLVRQFSAGEIRRSSSPVG